MITKMIRITLIIMTDRITNIFFLVPGNSPTPLPPKMKGKKGFNMSHTHKNMDCGLISYIPNIINKTCGYLLLGITDNYHTFTFYINFYYTVVAVRISLLSLNLCSLIMCCLIGCSLIS